MKKINVFLTSILIQSYYYPIMAMNYEDIFANEIYDQSTIKHCLTTNSRRYKTATTEEQLAVWKRLRNGYEEVTAEEKKDILEHLYTQKDRALDRTHIANINLKMQSYRDLCKTDEDRSIVQAASKGLTELANVALENIPLIGKSLSTYLTKYNILNPVFAQALPTNIRGALEKELRDLSLELERLKNGIRNEPIKEQEEEYVLKKKWISPDLQDVIENALIKSRKRMGGFVDLSNFIANALRLPITHKKLVPPIQGSSAMDHQNCLKGKDKNFQWLRKKFESDAFIKGFEENTREALWEVGAQMYFNSLASDGSGALRQCLYIWGNPGVGKTVAARHLCTLMEVPSYEADVRAVTDLSQANIEGSTLYSPAANMGWLVNALMTKDLEDGKTYKNAVLIFNDFDRFLFNGGPDGARATAALGFLLTYLDLQKKSFSSPYFNSPIDISRMSIIITGNKPIPEGDGGPQDHYKALRSRLKTIHFPDFPDGNIREILKKNSAEAIGHYDLYPLAYYGYPNSERWGRRRSLIELYLLEKTIIECPSKSIRDLETDLRKIAFKTKSAFENDILNLRSIKQYLETNGINISHMEEKDFLTPDEEEKESNVRYQQNKQIENVKEFFKVCGVLYFSWYILSWMYASMLAFL